MYRNLIFLITPLCFSCNNSDNYLADEQTRLIYEEAWNYAPTSNNSRLLLTRMLDKPIDIVFNSLLECINENSQDLKTHQIDESIKSQKQLLLTLKGKHTSDLNPRGRKYLLLGDDVLTDGHIQAYKKRVVFTLLDFDQVKPKSPVKIQTVLIQNKLFNLVAYWKTYSL